jgi:hypothetical protein
MTEEQRAIIAFVPVLRAAFREMAARLYRDGRLLDIDDPARVAHFLAAESQIRASDELMRGIDDANRTNHRTASAN